MKSLPIIIGLLGALIGGITGCSKLLDAPPPPTSIVEEKVFANDPEAMAALSGVYYKMINSNVPTLFNGAMTIYTGLAGDELVVFDASNIVARQFEQNNIQINNPIPGTNFWEAAYGVNYQCNAIMTGVNKSGGLSPSVRSNVVGQALFVRSLLYYYLTTVFGNVPLVTSIDWRSTQLQAASPVSDIYQQLVQDLLVADSLLSAANIPAPANKGMANRWAVKGLLAKAYAEQKNWVAVHTICDSILQHGPYQLAATPAEVFGMNSTETILALLPDVTSYTFNATREGMTLLPIDGIFPFPPFAYVQPTLLSAFEPGDLRKAQWLKSRTINGVEYVYPYKYKIGPSQAQPNGVISEPYGLLRLAEVYLLQAEAKLHLGETTGAITDINRIRQRAGLDLLPQDLPATSVHEALEQEQRIELFCEGGLRWINAKRSGKAKALFTDHKDRQVPEHGLLFPLPASELLTNPNLVQNPGY